MAASHRASKQWPLTKNEIITSYKSLGQNLVYTYSTQILPHSLKPCGKKRKETRHQSLQGSTRQWIVHSRGKTFDSRPENCSLWPFLDQIVNFCPIISRSSIAKTFTFLNEFWQTGHEQFGFQSSGVQFLDLVNIKLQPDKRPEDLFQRLMAFFEDICLMQAVVAPIIMNRLMSMKTPAWLWKAPLYFCGYTCSTQAKFWSRSRYTRLYRQRWDGGIWAYSWSPNPIVRHYIVHYGKPPLHKLHPMVCGTQTFLLRTLRRTIVLPGNYQQLEIPADSNPDKVWAWTSSRKPR